MPGKGHRLDPPRGTRAHGTRSVDEHEAGYLAVRWAAPTTLVPGGGGCPVTYGRDLGSGRRHRGPDEVAGRHEKRRGDRRCREAGGASTPHRGWAAPTRASSERPGPVRREWRCARLVGAARGVTTTVFTTVGAGLGGTARQGGPGNPDRNPRQHRKSAGGGRRRDAGCLASDQGVLSPLWYRCGDPPSSPVARRCRAVRPGAERDLAPATTAKFTAMGVTFGDSGLLHPKPRGKIYRASTTFATRGGSGRHA